MTKAINLARASQAGQPNLGKAEDFRQFRIIKLPVYRSRFILTIATLHLPASIGVKALWIGFPDGRSIEV